MSENYFYIIYKNPNLIPIIDTTLINQLNRLKNAKSYNEQTNINQFNNNLPFILNIQALKKNGE